jgi:hypothetical protein
VAGRRAWAAGPDRLVVALAADKALLVQRDGAGPDLREFLRGFDLAALEQALDRPPRIDFRRNADAFRVLHAGAAYSEVVAWVGFGDEHVGRDGHVLVYHLPEGGRVLLTFRDSEGLAAARLERADGRGEALIPEA